MSKRLAQFDRHEGYSSIAINPDFVVSIGCRKADNTAIITVVTGKEWYVTATPDQAAAALDFNVVDAKMFGDDV